jgi:hypothetical protein
MLVIFIFLYLWGSLFGGGFLVDNWVVAFGDDERRDAFAFIAFTVPCFWCPPFEEGTTFDTPPLGQRL